VAVQWGGHLCKGFLMQGLVPGGEAQAECWLFVPPSRKNYTYTIIFLPCEVWFEAGRWWVLMPHQPALPLQHGATSPGLFIPRPPRSPPPARTRQQAVVVRITALSCCIVQNGVLKPESSIEWCAHVQGDKPGQWRKIEVMDLFFPKHESSSAEHSAELSVKARSQDTMSSLCSCLSDV
jgi:hypothetical protein